MREVNVATWTNTNEINDTTKSSHSFIPCPLPSSMFHDQDKNVFMDLGNNLDEENIQIK